MVNNQELYIINYINWYYIFNDNGKILIIFIQLEF